LLSKTDLINWLGAEYGYSSYLEVATMFTGHRFSSISREIYTNIERIMYLTPADFNDEMIVSCQSPAEESCLCFKELIDREKKFDVVLVDPFHTYESSRRDLELALLVLDENGTLVVHDCNPVDKALTSPEFNNSLWMGETYLAFLDMLGEKNFLNYCVVDIDFGCAVVRWNNAEAVEENNTYITRTSCRKLSGDSAVPYYEWEYFREHHARLLNLKSATEFKKSYQIQSG